LNEKSTISLTETGIKTQVDFSSCSCTNETWYTVEDWFKNNNVPVRHAGY